MSWKKGLKDKIEDFFKCPTKVSWLLCVGILVVFALWFLAKAASFFKAFLNRTIFSNPW